MKAKLKKISTQKWRGNGFGTSGAEWTIDGYDGTVVYGERWNWGVWLNGKRVVIADTKNEAVEAFLSKYANLA